MEYLEPWYAASDPLLVTELRREVAPGHVLFGVPVSTLARRQDCDDVLFMLLDGSGRLAKVHLTWQPEPDTSWPATTVYPNEKAWAESMNEDHAHYGA
jgi:hypothetical protein